MLRYFYYVHLKRKISFNQIKAGPCESQSSLQKTPSRFLRTQDSSNFSEKTTSRRSSYFCSTKLVRSGRQRRKVSTFQSPGSKQTNFSCDFAEAWRLASPNKEFRKRKVLSTLIGHYAKEAEHHFQGCERTEIRNKIQKTVERSY